MPTDLKYKYIINYIIKVGSVSREKNLGSSSLLKNAYFWVIKLKIIPLAPPVAILFAGKKKTFQMRGRDDRNAQYIPL